MKKKLIVQEYEVSVLRDDYMSLTDIAKSKNPDEPKDVVKNWLRNKNTIEFLGLWEKINNPLFKGVEFDLFKNEAGTNSFTLSPSKWCAKTQAKEWKDKNSDKKGNMRDYAFVEQLVVLANLETLNAEFIKQDLSPEERFRKLNAIAIEQMKLLLKYDSKTLSKKKI